MYRLLIVFTNINIYIYVYGYESKLGTPILTLILEFD